MTRKSCAKGMCNAILGNHLNKIIRLKVQDFYQVVVDETKCQNVNKLLLSRKSRAKNLIKYF